RPNHRGPRGPRYPYPPGPDAAAQSLTDTVGPLVHGRAEPATSTSRPLVVAGWAGSTGGVDGTAVAAAFSRAMKVPSSPIVLISGAGKTTVVFLSTPRSTRL